MDTSLYQLLKSENSISSSHNNYIGIYLNLIILFLFRLSMADLSTAKKGDITIDKNVAYNSVKQSTDALGESRSGAGGGGSGRSEGDEGGHQEYEVISASDSHLPSQVSSESSLGRGGGGNITPPHPPLAATSTGGDGGEEVVYEHIPGGQ